MGYLTIAEMNADLLRSDSPVRSKLQKISVRYVRRWLREDVERHRAPCRCAADRTEDRPTLSESSSTDVAPDEPGGQ
jgi:hypothetical protein